MSESKTPVCDANRVDVGWIIFTHNSNREFVPLEKARELELELNEARKELAHQIDMSCQCEVALRSQLTAAQQEIEDLKRTCAELVTDGNAITLAQSLQQKCEELMELRKDKERLDWLSNPDKCYFIEIQSQPNGDYIYCSHPFQQDVRQAIDSAMEKGKG